jgi:hypothetical protein
MKRSIGTYEEVEELCSVERRSKFDNEGAPLKQAAMESLREKLVKNSGARADPKCLRRSRVTRGNETRRDYVVVENYRLLSIEMGLGTKAENAQCRTRKVDFPREKVRCDALQSTKRDG